MKKDKWARQFHDTYERLAPKYGYETREDTKDFDQNSPNGKLMIEVCDIVVGKAQKEAVKGFITWLLRTNLGNVIRCLDDNKENSETIGYEEMMREYLKVLNKNENEKGFKIVHKRDKKHFNKFER